MISCKTEIWKNVLNFSDDLSDNKQGLKQPSCEGAQNTC